MKNYTQVYVKNSIEAAELYCKAFGAEVTREFYNETNTAYEHCELSVNGEGFLALAEASNPCDIDVVHKNKWETMTFRACSHKISMQIFVHNFVACKAKFCRNMVIFQKILTKQAAKFAEKMHTELYVNTL